MAFEPILQSLDGAEAMLVPYKFFNGAIIVVFAFLVPLLTLEINYFRLAVFRNWYAGERDKRRRARRRHKRPEDDVRSDSVCGQSAQSSNRPVSTLVCEIENASILGDSRSRTQDCMQQTQALQYEDDASSSSSIGEGTISSILLDNVLSHAMANSHVRDSASVSGLSSKYATSCHSQDQGMQTQQQHQPQSCETALTGAYSHIRKASFSTISFWMALYLATAAGIAFSTRGLEEKVVAIIGGGSKFMASLLLFIVSAKIPQWLGVYHQGSILLVKHSSPFSLHLQHLDLTNLSDLALLKTHVRMGVGFHFAKFYVVLMPFYCGSNGMSVVSSMLLGVVVGFILMWFVFMVHKKYIHHRNVVASSTIFILVAISSLTFVRGMAWIQVVWRKHIFDDGDALLAISFFSWLVLLISVHMLFLWHTVEVEKKKRNADVRRDDVENDRIDDNREDTAEMVDVINLPRTRKINKSPSVVAGLPRQPSYSSHLFDPRTHFKDGNGRFSEMSEFVSLDGCDSASVLSAEQQLDHEEEGFAQVEIIVGDLTEEAESIMNPGKYEIDGGACNSELVKSDKFEEEDLSCLCAEDDVIKLKTSAQRFFTRKHPVWCEVFVCFSPEYRQSSLPWKIVCWVKIFIISMTHMLFLYFVIVCIGATAQVNNTKAKLPYVHKAIYKHMNEGPVCAFDNRGPDSNITTFADENAAHEAGFLVLHCGACGACSSWENLKIEYTTRNTMSELANECAKVSLFGGDDAITDCLMAPEIGFEPTCAQCWMEDIVCTREHCAFIFLQSQMINNVGNFAVGPNEITSASCEEANCEAGNPGEFVSCSGATRRRMNITSSIARPGEQQCAIVDVKDWNDLFFGSGVA